MNYFGSYILPEVAYDINTSYSFQEFLIVLGRLHFLLSEFETLWPTALSTIPLSGNRQALLCFPFSSFSNRFKILAGEVLALSSLQFILTDHTSILATL